jgi:hypothetical protein
MISRCHAGKVLLTIFSASLMRFLSSLERKPVGKRRGSATWFDRDIFGQALVGVDMATSPGQNHIWRVVIRSVQAKELADPAERFLRAPSLRRKES